MTNEDTEPTVQNNHQTVNEDSKESGGEPKSISPQEKKMNINEYANIQQVSAELIIQPVDGV